MILPAPQDFWARVIDRFAQLLFERENARGGMKDEPLPTHTRPLAVLPDKQEQSKP